MFHSYLDRIVPNITIIPGPHLDKCCTHTWTFPIELIETNRISCTCDCSYVCFSSNIIIYIVGFCGRAYQTGSCFSLSLYFSFQIYHFRFCKRTSFLVKPTIFVAYLFLKIISRFLKRWYCQGWKNIWSNFNDHRSLSFTWLILTFMVSFVSNARPFSL